MLSFSTFRPPGSAEETLVGKAVAEDGTSRDVLLRSRVDPTSGGLCWLPVDANVAAEGTMLTAEGARGSRVTQLFN